MTSPLLQPDVLARAKALGLAARQLVEGLRVGDHRSPYRGFSAEFAQHRGYAPGDDLRHVDWKGYGRTERYTVKQFEQETNFVGHLLVDGSNSMRYGDGTANKLAYAKLLAASLAYLLVRQGDGVGLRVFDSGWRAEVPAAGHPSQVAAVCRALEAVEPSAKTGAGPLLEEFAGRTARRGLVFVVSDGFEDVGGLLRGLRRVRSRGHEVTLFHVLHRDEVEFPLTGDVRFTDLEGGDALTTRPDLVRPAYLRAVAAYLRNLERGCADGRVEYALMRTDRPPAAALGVYLARRRGLRPGVV